MSDFNSSLPVRTEAAGDVIIKVADATVTSQQLAINADGSVNIEQATAANLNATVVQGTSPWISKDQSDGPVAPGTVASFASLGAGQYNATPPTLTDTQQAALQLDASGKLLVKSTSADDHNFGVVGATTLRTAAQVGNATGAADFNAGATGAQTLRTQANQGAPNTIGNAWPVSITDGTNSAAVTASGEVKVDITQPLPAGTNIIGKVSQDTSPWIVKDQADGSVSGGTVASFSALAGGQYNSSAPTLTTAQQAALQLDVSGNLKTTVASALPAGSNLIGQVNLDVGGSLVSATNPVPVVLSAGVSGTVVNNYNTSASLAAAGSSNHTYTITTSKAFQGKKIHATASGKLKIEVQISPDGTAFTSIFVAFNSTANPNIDIDMDQILFLEASGAGAAVRVIRTNLDKSAEDVYSTISGVEV